MKDHFTYVEAYVKGRLSSEARQDFELALSENEDLREAVDNYDKIEPILDLLIEEDIRERMGAISKKDTRSIRLRTWSRIAASLLVLSLALGWLWSSVANSPKQLFAQFYQAPLSTNSRSAVDDAVSLFDSDRKSLEAHRLLNNNQPQEAEQLFSEILTARSKSKNDAVEWYLIMTALKAGDKALARDRLESILGQPEHDYYEKATQLDKKLSGFLGLGI